jgi:hypothetical protein
MACRRWARPGIRPGLLEVRGRWLLTSSEPAAAALDRGRRDR